MNSKSSVTIQGLKKQNKSNGYICINYTIKNICPKFYTNKKHFITKNKNYRAEKAFPNKIKKKYVIANHKDVIDVKSFMKKQSIQNPYAKQENKLLIYIYISHINICLYIFIYIHMSCYIYSTYIVYIKYVYIHIMYSKQHK